MKILLDMNLSPSWIRVLRDSGYSTTHWSDIGAPNAPDTELLSWAKTNGYVLFTHDLDFGCILAATQADFPSVVQLRTQDITPAHASPLLLSVLRECAKQLEEGCLVSVDEDRLRARLLPLRKA